MKKAISKDINGFKSKIKTAKKNKQVGKYGLIGNSGLGVGGFFHISMPYDCDGKVFALCKLRQKLPNGKIDVCESWKRVDKSKAKEKDIIRCAFCEKPAVRLDHLWPYHSEMNACEAHLDKFKKCLETLKIVSKKHKKNAQKIR